MIFYSDRNYVQHNEGKMKSVSRRTGTEVEVAKDSKIYANGRYLHERCHVEIQIYGSYSWKFQEGMNFTLKKSAMH